MKNDAAKCPTVPVVRRWDGGTVSLTPYVISRLPRREKAQPEDVSRQPKHLPIRPVAGWQQAMFSLHSNSLPCGAESDSRGSP